MRLVTTWSKQEDAGEHGECCLVPVLFAAASAACCPLSTHPTEQVPLRAPSVGGRCSSTEAQAPRPGESTATALEKECVKKLTEV